LRRKSKIQIIKWRLFSFLQFATPVYSVLQNAFFKKMAEKNFP